jgi:RNA polymerase sigma-70 factor (ECF subfamily)
MHADVPQLLLSHRSWLRRLARDLLQEADADDAVQETLRAALASPPRDAGVLRAWLRRVLENVAHRMRRRDGRARRRDAAFAAATAAGTVPETPPEVAAQQELANALTQAVRALAEPYRTTLHLRYHDDLSPARIAAATGVPVATVKTRLRRGREQLRTELDRRGGVAAWRAVLPALSAGGAMPARAAAAWWLVALAGGLGVAVLATVRSPATDPARPGDAAAVSGTAGAPAPAAFAPPPATPRVDPPPQDPAAGGVRVQLRTADGGVAAGARLMVFVGPQPGGDRGRWTRAERRTADGDGRVTVAAADGIDVQCTLVDARWRLRDGAPSGATATAPAELTLTVEPVPHARLLVRVHDVATGEPVRAFRCAFHVPTQGTPWPEPGASFHGGFADERTETGEVEFFVAARAGTARVQVDLREPGTARERLELSAGATRVVQLGVRSGPRVRGTVVDAAGRPLAGALVFAGGQQRARGDEPGQPFVAARVRDGVRTGADGTFELDAAALITAWHPDCSPRTVPATAANRIELASLATVRGRLLDERGAPRPNVPLRLDRTTSAVTDADGAFVFERVERGARVVHVPGDDAENPARARGGPWVVRVDGDAATIELTPGLPELRLELRDGGDARVVALVGLASATSLATATLHESTARFAGVVPGRYHLLTDRGAQLPVVVDGPLLTVACAAPTLGHVVVDHLDSGPVHALPLDADDLVRTLSARVVRVRRTAATPTVRLGPLPFGEYRLSRGDEPRGEPFRVGAAEIRVDWR